jgi:hypothetical protein
MTKIQDATNLKEFRARVLNIWALDFDIVSDLDIRISDLKTR